jgi:uncharacterized protein YkwD
MPNTLPRALIFLAALALTLEALLPLVAPSAARGDDSPPAAQAPVGDPALASLEAQLYTAINGIRAQHHRVTLTRDPTLDRAARGHALDMATRHYFSHETPEGLNPVDRIQRAGATDFTLAAENVGMTSKRNPNQEIVQGWMHSPAHRENLLAPAFNATGLGIARAADGTYYYTQVFATFPR